jgi:cellulose synthase/poly-beta-1,6-N-acetylglucosamine synthase-like glycosyltransferase
MIIIFWLCLGLIIYTYLIYPLLIMIWARLFPQKIKIDKNYFPSVTMVIAAHNEENNLREKMNNCLELDYPPGKIDFMIGCDGSTDGTPDILQESTDPRIKAIIFSERRGKIAVLNDLMSKAAGEVTIFSDANTIYQTDAIKKLVQYFADPRVGGVCGKLQLINPDGNPGGEGEGLYWRFENQIKKAEGAIRSVISANGAIFAVRKELFRPLSVSLSLNDDLMTTLDILREHQRVIYEPDAAAAEYTSPNMEGEFARKIRISSQNFNAVPGLLTLLHPRYGFTALAIFSHKLLRWMVPFLGFGMLLTNLVLLSRGGIYPFLMIGQSLVYGGALMGYLGDRLFGRSGPFIPFYYLAMINIAIVLGLWRSLTKTQEQTWKRVPH